MRIRLRRRRFGQLVIISIAIAVLGNLAKRTFAQMNSKPPAPITSDPTSEVIDMTLRVNGKDQNLKIEPRVTLLDALRERIGLTGTKKGSALPAIAACTVLVDGRRVLSCLTLAVTCEEKSVTTIEGLAKGDELHPLQAAFV